MVKGPVKASIITVTVHLTHFAFRFQQSSISALSPEFRLIQNRPLSWSISCWWQTWAILSGIEHNTDFLKNSGVYAQ